MIKNLNKYIQITAIAGVLLLSTGFIYAKASTLDELREEARMRAQEAREKIETLREQAQNRVQAIRENVKQRISQIRDQRKRAAAEKINNQFDRINTVWTDHFTNVLDRLDAILQKVKSRTQKAEDNGQDVSVVNTTIQNAESKIVTARSAVTAQAQKTYLVDVSAVASNDQNNLVSQFREEFKAMRDQLFNDLTLLRDGAMKDARSAVQNALQILSQVPNVDEEPATNSNNQ